jgi:hypothetical protein
VLSENTVKGTKKELEAIDALVEEHCQAGRPASITRTEPNEKGPLRVEIGRRSWLVSADGKAKQES